MIRKVAGIVLYVFSAFFFCGAMMMAFANVPSLAAKLLMLLLFVAPAVLALLGGLALRRFQGVRKEIGVVLLSASAWGAFQMFVIISLFMSEEVQKLMPPSTENFLTDYWTGGAVLVGFAGLGLLFFSWSKVPSKKLPQSEPV